MNLRQFRKMFRNLSGRFDLVNEDYSDSGVETFIFEGQKFLDRLDETQKSWATRFAPLSTDALYVTFPYCRAIKEVWAASSTEGRWQLEKKDLQDLMEGYLMTLPDEMESGTPLYYSPCITRSVPPGATLNSFEEFMGYVEVAGNEYNAILVNVPTSEDITLIIHGLFHTPQMIEDTDSNYWSDEHPLLLYMATMRHIEVINRNTQGVNDWDNSIAVQMKQIGMDLVEELIAEVNQMEG
jgi:hypothetical protein